MTERTPGSAFEFPEDQPGIIGARYRRGDYLGHGSDGVVYRAIDEWTGETVAIKTAPVDFSEGLAENLRREYKVLLALDHPNIVRIRELIDDNGLLCLVMDYMEGQTLRALIDESALQPSRAAAFLIQIASAVSYLHRGRRFHRDLKPDNILVSNNDRILLIDFGSSIEEGELPREDGKVRTTYPYASSDVLFGISSRIDRRAEVYSLGMIMEELLLGARLSRETSKEGAAIDAILRTLGPPALPDRFPRALRDIYQRCNLPTNRGGYFTVDELLNDLKVYYGDSNHLPESTSPTARFANQRRFLAWKLAVNMAEAIGYHARHVRRLPDIVEPTEQEQILDILPQGDPPRLDTGLTRTDGRRPPGGWENTFGVIVGYEIQSLTSFEEAGFWASHFGINFGLIAKERHQTYHRLIRRPRSATVRDIHELQVWAGEVSQMMNATIQTIREQVPVELQPFIELRLLIADQETRETPLTIEELLPFTLRLRLSEEVNRALSSIILAHQPSLDAASRHLSAFDRLVETVVLYESSH